MTTQILSPFTRVSTVSSGRAQFSPLLRRLAPFHATRVQDAPRFERGSPASVPLTTANEVEPLIETPRIRWWNTHVVDGLRTPLTRHHD